MRPLRTFIPREIRRAIKIRRAKLFEALGSERFSSPGLNGMDSKLALHLPPIGTFLEVGANDGYSQSNTYALERRGWRGILIEPIPSLYERCRRVRPLSYVVNAACVAAGEPDEVDMIDMDLMSVALGQQDAAEERRRTLRRGRPLRVPARTLSGIIDASPFRSFDFMSIDVEGAELSLLAGLDLDLHCPTWLLVETAQPDAVAGVLTYRMEPVGAFSAHDYLFRRRLGG